MFKVLILGHVMEQKDCKKLLGCLIKWRLLTYVKFKLQPQNSGLISLYYLVLEWNFSMSKQ